MEEIKIKNNEITIDNSLIKVYTIKKTEKNTYEVLIGRFTDTYLKLWKTYKSLKRAKKALGKLVLMSDEEKEKILNNQKLPLKKDGKED